MRATLRRALTSNPIWFALIALIALSFVAFTLSLPTLGYLSSDRSVAAIGVLLLFTIELPLYFWLVVLRPGRIRPIYAVPVAALGYAFCRLWTPGADSPWIAWAWIPLAPLEIFLFAILARRFSRVVRTARSAPGSSDLIDRLALATEREFPRNRMLGMLAYEAGVIYYALGGGPGLTLKPADAAFSYHRRGSFRLIYAVALSIGAFEMTGLHLLVSKLSPLSAWILTGFEFYGLVWVVGLLRSVGRLPIVLDELGVHVRMSVIYSLFVPYDAIESIQRQRLFAVDTRRRNYLNCAFVNAPDCVIKLRGARRVRLPYTLSRNVDEIGLMVDDPRQFLAQLDVRMAQFRAQYQPGLNE